VPQTQAIDYIANDPFPAESHEEGLDRATMTIQQMQEELDRSFKVSSTNSITTPEFTDNAATRASKTLGFDSTGQVLTTVADFLPAGGDSALFQYSTTTADADPGAGFFRLDNATIASATEMFIDDLEYNGTNIEAWVQSWDDVTGNDTNRGRIRITKAQSLDTWMVFKVAGAITNASGYTKVTLVYIDSAGTFTNNDKCWIAFTASGEDGAIPGYFYKFDTNTADSDPGAGELKFNNGTYASATAIYIDDADANGVTTQADTATWGASDSVIKGYIHIVDINDSSTYARFKVGAAVTDASGYNKITVAHLASNNTFSAADELSVTFVRNGDFGTAATLEVGTVGVSTVGAGGSATATVANGGTTSEASFNFAFGLPTGATGATGSSGTNSQLAMTWSSSTSDADPGAGKIAFNNGTLGSVSILYVDDADDAGATISSFVQSWDDVSNGVARGIVTVTKEGTPATYALFKVTGAVTNASGYTKVPVTHVVSSGTFSNTDGVGVHFSYSGVDGSGNVSTDGVQTLTNKTLTSPKINEDVALTSTATELNKLDAVSRGSIIYGNASAATAILTKGSANTVLTSDGTDIAWSAPAAGGIEWQSSIVTGTTLTAVAGRGYWINTTSNVCTITLPSSASVGDQLIFTDYARKWGTNNVTLNRNGLKFQGGTVNPVYDVNGQSVDIVYSGATNGWIPNSDDDVTDESLVNYNIDFLVIAGGAGGGRSIGAGGGAGGYRNSFGSETSGGGGSSETALTVGIGIQYTVTIGAGGAGTGSDGAVGTNGGNSSISGTGITTITSIGGGGGGGSSGTSGAAGGSGGGNHQSNTGAGGAGTSNQGFAGGAGAGGTSGTTGGGGGGGASEVGEAGQASGGGDGGDGLASAITGSSVARGGGGGGSGKDSGTVGAGGTGGGGNSNSGSTGTASAGTANTGGGGGATHDANPAAAGGSGVVILSMPDASYSGTVSGSPTVNTGVSGKTVITFNASGSYTS
jgi:hypothetical protein